MGESQQAELRSEALGACAAQDGHEGRSVRAFLLATFGCCSHNASSAWPFLESINTIIDQVPNYFDIIEKGTERDLGTIKANVEADKYSSVEEIESDIELMLNNCFTFNAPDNQVYKSGEELQKMFKAGFARINADGKKRSGEKSSGGPSKKQKV